MKRTLSLFAILLFAGLGNLNAQNLEKPRSGNEIRLKDYTVTVAQGEEIDLQMWVVKAKKYNLVVEAPKASAKEGIHFTFEQQTEVEDPLTYDMKVKVDASTPVGDYLCILKVPGKGRSAVTGSTIKIKVVQND
ncbi:hypothetical protein [Roseivirga seohaensis]|uniref:Uncharacterized protein n=2 Tax=Roseivirga seohaensis TaxID=1914963 RepID=A0A0L8ALY5_9BACT|nr:hypothetical protein [Roseivirga seohaensis]KOF03329.1 hypothetical protein OB69_08580 [Roseivirga seohaensis subsp. aquiponti]KYG79811.1 hypothetical protein AWW67_10890 [Roseivirga seohaensis]